MSRKRGKIVAASTDVVRVALLLATLTAGARAQTFDHRHVQSPVKQQGARGTCAAFAVNAALETLPGFSHDLSEQLLHGLTKLSRQEAVATDEKRSRRALMDGGLLLSDYARTLQAYGVTYEDLVPYDRRKPRISGALAKFLPAADRGDIARALYAGGPLSKEQRRKLWQMGKYKVHEVELLDLFAMRRDHPQALEQRARLAEANARLERYLSAGGLGHYAVPVSYAIDMESWSIYSGKSATPVISLAQYPFDVKTRGGHAVTIVGFTRDVHAYAPSAPAHLKGDGFWIVKNSWGADWGGLGGYGLVSFAYHDMCAGEALLVKKHGVLTWKKDVGWYDNRPLTTRGDFRLKLQPVTRSRPAATRGKTQSTGQLLLLTTLLQEPAEANVSTVRYVVRFRPGTRTSAEGGARRWEAPGLIVSPRLHVPQGESPDRSFRYVPRSEAFTRALSRILSPRSGVEERLEIEVLVLLHDQDAAHRILVRAGRRYRTEFTGGGLESRELRPVAGGILDAVSAERLLNEASAK